MKKLVIGISVALGLMAVLALSACAGPAGPAGPSGPAGASGAAAGADTKITTSHGELTLGQIAEIQPGLGTVMQEYGKRFAMVKMAVEADDWGMAAYQLEEQLEIQEVGEATRPANANLLKGFENSALVPIQKDIQDKNKTAFETDYANAINGCNGCHAATGHPYIQFQMPQTSPEPFLKLGPSEP